MGLCESCHVYKTFGKKCWFYWDKKKSCSQFRRSAEDVPEFCSQDMLE